MCLPLLLASDSSSSSRNWSYDVFSSFSGEDVRKSLLSHFLTVLERKSINVFKDNEMEKGHSISSKLVEAIRGSRMAVVVFSKNYASSSWCLNELLEILKCKKKFGQMVIPIFYGLDPSHVRKQIGDFGEAFKKTCEKQTNEVIIYKWKKGLTYAANLTGYHSANWGTDAEGIEELSNVISDKLNPTPSNDYEDLVGIEDHISNITSMLRLESEEVRKFGIWGASGIGKTTIARALSRHLSPQFQNSVYIDRAFIANIKEAYGRPHLYDHNIRLKLQENYLGEMDLKGGIEVKLNHRKVLTIIDDLDDPNVLDALAGKTKRFGNGSRIIGVTTNKHVLKAHKIDDDSIYEVNLPSDGQALEIFCRAAFNQNIPLHGLEMFASEVVELVGNLPLGLTVMGSLVRGKNKEACLDILPRLRRNLNRQIEETLRFSYDELEYEEDKAIFRHIAYILYYEEVEDIKLYLADSKLDASTGLDNLFARSLIYATNSRVEMHTLLREMAINIVRKQSDDPGKREFLRDKKEICNVLRKGSGTEKLLGIKLNIDDGDEESHVHESAFAGMHNLRFLWIHNILSGKVKDKLKLPESFNYLPPKLKLLVWVEYPMRCMPSNFCPERLVKLNLSYSELEKLWEGVKDLRCLKAMYLYNSTNLKEIPDLSMGVNLEILDLSSCVSLVELPSTIRNLNKLSELRMKDCTKLEILPTGINLKSLSILDLDGCKMLKTFPEISTNISLLKMNGTSVEELPSHNLYLDKLITLCLGNQVRQGMQLLTPFIPMLSPSLMKLVLKDIPSLVELPSSFQNFNQLLNLEIVDCVNLKTLPHRINIKSLMGLDLSGCSRLRSFPNISTNISNLNLSRTGIEEVPQWIDEFSRLKALNMEDCSKLEYVHLNISKLKHFEKANFSKCGALTGVDLRGYASGVAMQADNFDSSSIPEIQIKVSLKFSYCFHLDHVVLPRQHPTDVCLGLEYFLRETFLLCRMIELNIYMPPLKRRADQVVVEFLAVGDRNPWPRSAADPDFIAIDDRDAKFDLIKSGIQMYKHCSSTDYPFYNETTLRYICGADEDNVDSDGFHESEQVEECGGSNDSDTARETDQNEESESNADNDTGSETDQSQEYKSSDDTDAGSETDQSEEFDDNDIHHLRNNLLIQILIFYMIMMIMNQYSSKHSSTRV